MKRIALFGLLLPLLSYGQILVDVPLSDGVLPATWQNVDVDGFAADVFYTDQGIWAGSTAWEEVNFSSYGRAFYSTSNFETATGNANDWMITDAITITQETRLDFELVSSQFNGPESHTVYVTSSIAGTTPQPSDFVAPGQNFTTVPGQWSSNEADLSAYIGSTIYIAFVNDNPSSGNIQGIRNIIVRELLSSDVSIEAFNSNAVNQRTPLNSTTRYSVLDYSKTSAFQPRVTLRNQGLNALDSVVITMNIDDDVTGYAISDTYTLSPALAAGDTTTIALAAIGLDTLFPALQTNQELDVEIFTDSSNGNGLSLAEDTVFSFMINPRQYFSPPYTTSFEYVLGGSSFSWEWNEWGWKSLDVNNDNDALLVDQQTSYPAADGAYMLFSGVRYSGAVTNGDIGDYVETPEMQFDTGDYVLSMLGAAITGSGST
ncbi:MAG: choice-of-anchor J domain-containing protein, partial [Bacteroidota bacterium]|nr:choice-of-anchor J domain-containing protein [Bacteroidota bacterium]